MKVLSNHLAYAEQDRICQVQESFSNGLSLNFYVQIASEKFVDYQREIFEDFLANFLEKISDITLSSREIEQMVEEQLKQLNHQLYSFAEKLHDLPRFDLRGYLQIMIDEKIKIWMIGDSSLLIFRDGNLYSTLENAFDQDALIDLFTDYIGGEVQREDVYLYAGIRLSDLLDQQDVAEMEGILKESNAENLLNALWEVLTSRVNKEQIWFLASYALSGIDVSQLRVGGRKKLLSFTQKYLEKLQGKIDLWAFKNKTNPYLRIASYHYVLLGVLCLFVVVLGFSVLKQYSWSSQQISIVSGTGASQTITLDQLKRDIATFQSLEASSDEKSIKYAEILNTFQQIEALGVWQADIKNLKELLNSTYEQGYNVAKITSFSQFDDPSAWKKTEILTLSEAELKSLGTPVSLTVSSQMNIAGDKGAMIGIVNDSTRGTMVMYNGTTTAKDCTLSISKRGLFCYSDTGDLFYVAKTGVEAMETSDGEWSTRNIGGVVAFNKSLYLFQKNPLNFASILLTRYQNIAGSESQYRNGQNYAILAWSGANIPASMAGFTIDQTFLAWGDGKLYQFWRPDGASNKLDYREVPMQWGDKTASYSDEVKVLASDSSPYVSFFDKVNQTFTVYESSPIKTNANHKQSFKLYYLFRFKFDLSKISDRIVDVAIADASADRPELYILTTKSLHKINMYEMIDAVASHKSLPTT